MKVTAAQKSPEPVRSAPAPKPAREERKPAEVREEKAPEKPKGNPQRGVSMSA